MNNEHARSRIAKEPSGDSWNFDTWKKRLLNLAIFASFLGSLIGYPYCLFWKIPALEAKLQNSARIEAALEAVSNHYERANAANDEWKRLSNEKADLQRKEIERLSAILGKKEHEEAERNSHRPTAITIFRRESANLAEYLRNEPNCDPALVGKYIIDCLSSADAARVEGMLDQADERTIEGYRALKIKYFGNGNENPVTLPPSPKEQAPDENIQNPTSTTPKSKRKLE